MVLSSGLPPIMMFRPVTTAPSIVLLPLDVSVPPTRMMPFQLFDPLIVKSFFTINVPRPSPGNEKGPGWSIKMTGQLVENVDEDGHDPLGIVTSGVMADPSSIDGQSIPTVATACVLVPMLLMFGEPLGTDEPPFWSYPGTV